MISGNIQRWRRWGFAYGLGVLLVVPLIYLDWGDSEYPDLKKAVRVLRFTTAKNQVSRSAFNFLEGEKTPSEFVDWMFSAMGTSEWYMTEDSSEFTEEEMKMIKRVTPVLPSGVAVFPYAPRTDSGRQVVIKPDDSRRMILVEAYLIPGDQPVFTDEWKFPELE